MKSATFVLPMPPSANRLWRSARKQKGVYPSEEYKAWINEAGTRLNLLRIPEMEPPYFVTYSLGTYPDKRRRDAFNFEKALSDLLVKSCVMVDDSMIVRGTVEWVDDVAVGTVRVCIETRAA